MKNLCIVPAVLVYCNRENVYHEAVQNTVSDHRKESAMDKSQLMAYIGQIVRVAKDETQAGLLLAQLEEMLKKDTSDEEQLALVRGLQNCVTDLLALPKDKPVNEEVLLLAYRRSMERKVRTQLFG